MPPEPRPPPASPGIPRNPFAGLVILAACLSAGLVASCSSFPEGFGSTPAPPVDKVCTSNAVLADYLQLMQRLGKGSTADKSEIFATAKKNAETTPTPTNSLRFALALATPGHAGTDRARAQSLLRVLVANPEALVPGEQTLALVELQQIDDYLNLQSDGKKLQDDSARFERLNHHLVMENEDLRKQNDLLKAKLEEIEKIETRPSKKGPTSSR